jgi:hypothetical protein
VYADSIDGEVAFRASRYEAGEGDYLNLPLDREAYERFVDDLLVAETVPLHSFEESLYFEGCLPIEEIARRGRDTLAFGPMRPPTPSCSCGRKTSGACSTTSWASRPRCGSGNRSASSAVSPVSGRRSLPATARCIATPT